MDVLDGVLDGPRARGAFLLRAVLDRPWCLRVVDESPLTVLAVVRGGAWVVPDGDPPQRLGPGDVAVARGPGHYTVADDPATPVTVTIGPGQVCSDAATGRHLAEEWSLGVRTWGSGTLTGGGDVVLVGTYERAGEVSRPLLAALPPLLALARDEWDPTLVDLLASEVARDGLGQRAVLDRLLDVLLIAVVRAWFTRRRDEAPAWYRAQSDPEVGRAVQLVQNHPEHPWTVASLAAAVGLSRAALARRFTGLLGEPPMTYLTRWRLALAADLLCRPDATLGAVAREVGYGTAFALSTAFKRERGISPREHRALAGAS